ncbi:MAG: dehydrogenase [Saprospiraceae bacterium]|nr:dehydrogenase [Saprospiraceae bacterium]
MQLRFLIFVVILSLIFGCHNQVAPAHSPEKEAATFLLAEDLSIQLVASEPMISEPVFLTFDEYGRLWVVEMRGFMPNIDGEGENDPIGRISILFDNDQDGQMDSSVVFIDSLILPRSLAIVKGGALVAERKPLWYVEDLDGDLRADRKTLIDSSFGGSGMPEHSPNGLLKGLDNWYYNAKSTARYRLINNTWTRDTTEFRGQWGISHDDLGRLYYNYNWSQLHADLVPPNYLSRNSYHQPTSGIDHGLTIDRKIFPVRPNPATNRGYIDGTLDSEGKLLEFTSASAPFVYRGAALPQFKGDVFVAEPAGNLIKRNIVDYRDPILTARAAYPDRDFLASTDERFRPVFFTSGPDGALYFADMYHGIIEHGPYMTEYLKEQTISRGLDKHIHFGRIWRITQDGFAPAKSIITPQTRTADLIGLLANEDGWYRDISQRLIIERNDLSVKSGLESFVGQAPNLLGKIHSLFTLEGLGLLTPEICQVALEQPEPEVKVVALRLAEPFASSNQQFAKDIHSFMLTHMATNKSLDLQISLSAQVLPEKEKIDILITVFNLYGHIGLFRDAIMSSLQGQEHEMLKNIYRQPTFKQQSAAEIFMEMLSTSVAKKGDAAEILNLLEKAKIGSDTLHWKQKAILRGLALGKVSGRDPVSLTTKPAIVDQANRLDGSMLPRLEKILNMVAWPGYYPDTSSNVTKSELSAKEQELFNLGRQHFTTSCSGCHGSEGEGLNRFAPPLVDSEWVLGDENRLSLLVLHGVEGPIEVNGKTYGSPDILPVMPSHSVLDDQVIASILTYIRCEWGHTAKPVSPRTVSRLRHTSQGRVQPWKVEDLNKHVATLEPTVSSD